MLEKYGIFKERKDLGYRFKASSLRYESSKSRDLMTTLCIKNDSLN